MMRIAESFRIALIRNMQPAAFLVAYFLTVVLGNIVLASPIGEHLLARIGYPMSLFTFETRFTLGFWLLLLIPFVITPLILIAVRFFASEQVAEFAKRIPEIHARDYFVITTIFYGYVFYSFWRAGAVDLALAGEDAVASVEARFTLLANIGFAPMAVLQSILIYISLYSLVRWLLSGGKTWAAASAVNVVLMSTLLIALNMKWPILLFYIGLSIAVFSFSKRYAYLKALACGVLLVAIYIGISVHVFRIPPPPSPEMAPYSQEASQTSLSGISQTAATYAPTLMLKALFRMSVIYPYYYEIGTTEGRVCGGLLAQAKRGPECRPSTYIYSRIFETDGFHGRGTSPAAVHVSAYTLEGWPLAIFALVCASVILALFACLPHTASATVGALWISGALAGYHFSQLPGEGPLIYDHGLLWTLLLIAAYSLRRFASARFKKLRVA